MTELREARLTDALPKAVAQQPWVQALAATWGEIAGRLLDLSERARVFTDLDNAPAELLDVLAIELRAPRYREDYDLETKRRIVKTSLPYYTTVGTKAAVERTMREMYGEAEIREWFEYAGTPGSFRVSINAKDAIDIGELLDILRQIKRASAKLDGLFLDVEAQQSVTVGFGSVTVGVFEGQTEKSELELV